MDDKPDRVKQIMRKALNAAWSVSGDPVVKELVANIHELHAVECDIAQEVRELPPHAREEVADLDAFLIDARKLEKQLWIKLDCHLTAKGL